MSDDPMNIERMVAEMNSNLPINRRALMDIVDSGNLTYSTRRGVKGNLSKEGVDYLFEICDDVERLRLRLPIFVSTDTMSDCGGWKVDGKVEASVVAKVLGKTLRREDLVQIYYPDLQRMKKLIPDTFVMVFLP